MQVSMGLSVYNKTSVVETIGSLHFGSNNVNQLSESTDMETVGLPGQERPDPTDIQQSDDIKIVDR